VLRLHRACKGRPRDSRACMLSLVLDSVRPSPKALPETEELRLQVGYWCRLGGWRVRQGATQQAEWLVFVKAPHSTVCVLSTDDHGRMTSAPFLQPKFQGWPRVPPWAALQHTPT